MDRLDIKSAMNIKGSCGFHFVYWRETGQLPLAYIPSESAVKKQLSRQLLT